MLPTTIVRLTLTGVVLLLPAANTAAAPVTYTVTKTADTDDGSCDADCSLREAITAANANSGQDTIAFNIPTGDAGFNGKWWRIKLDFIDPITLVNDLPPLTDGVTINGFTAQNTNTGTVGWKNTPGVLPDSDNPCYPLQFEKPEIAIDGEGASNGLTIDGSASNVTIQGLAIYDTTANAIEAGGGTGTSRLVTGMFIGVRPDGSNPGGERNQGFGVRQLDGGTLEVSWSYVGHNGLGGMDGEASTSVLIAKQNEVFKGGWNSGSHDGIDHNGKDGLAQCNLSRDNTNNTGVAEGDSGAGFEKGSSSENSFDLDNNLIEYNTAFRNRSSGISIRKGQRGEFIRKNVVWDNWVGISVNDEGRFPTNRHALSRNSIFKNRGLGIDLQRLVTAGVEWRQGDPGPDGINPNDPCDPDGNVGLTTDGDPGNIRSNDLQNYPDLTFAKRRKTKTQIQGTLDSTPNTTFLIEFFSTPAADLGSSADREGKFFLADRKSVV